MPDYSKSKIYRVFCEDDEYIGSTTRPLSERMGEHRRVFTNKHKYSTSFPIFEKHGIENVKIELIEEYPCENKEQLCKREGELQRERKCVNNKIAGRTIAQYYQDNKEILGAIKLKYYYDNRDKWKVYSQKQKQKKEEKITEHICSC